MYYLRLIIVFIRASLQQDMAYRSDFFIGLLNSLLNLITSIAGIAVLFTQVSTVHGWNFVSTLILLGVYLILGSLRNLFISPCFEALGALMVKSGLDVLILPCCVQSTLNS